MPATKNYRRHILLGFALTTGVVTAGFVFFHTSHFEPKSPYVLSKETIASALGSLVHNTDFPANVDISSDGHLYHAKVQYTLDENAQEEVEKNIARWKPDYAAFVAIDATNGQILSMVSYTHTGHDEGNLALRSNFPAASVFKVVTATAAIDQKIASPDTSIRFNGGYHTLYRRNVEKSQWNRWTHNMTLREAFAKSVNVVFSKLGLFRVGPRNLREYANRFEFNQTMKADFPIMMGYTNISDDDRWELAQAASGFTRSTTMSPVQGALIGAAVANNGVMMEPTLVDSVYDQNGKLLYHSVPTIASITMTSNAAAELRSMMRETIRSGTSRRSFRRALRHRKLADLEMGGKTGHLSGKDPDGHYDWFVGYARSKDRCIAVAALTINVKKWHVKSSELAGDYIADYFQSIDRRVPASATTIRQVRNQFHGR